MTTLCGTPKGDAFVWVPIEVKKKQNNQFSSKMLIFLKKIG